MADDHETGKQPRKVRNDERTNEDAREETASGGREPLVQSSSNADEKLQGGNGAEKEAKPKESSFSKVIGKVGLDVPTVMMMFKGSVAPLIGIAFFQADAVANTFSTLGYLIPIITVICVPIMPRAKYFQTILLNLIGICIGASIALLGIWSGVQARKHTTPAGSKELYNSSQAAVCAIWLFANIYFVNVLRAKVPALQVPVILYSIFTNVSFTNAPLLPTMANEISLIKRLLEGFLTAFAISTAVHVLILPVSSRTVAFKEMAGYLGLVRGMMKAQTAYLQSMESSDMFTPITEKDKTDDAAGKKHKRDRLNPTQNPQSKALKYSVAALRALHGKLYGDLPFAKREMAWGKLDAKDIEEIYVLLRGIFIPLTGLSTITDIFERIAERRGWIKSSLSEESMSSEYGEPHDESAKNEEKRVWNETMKELHEPFAVAMAAIDEGIEHIGLVLEFNKPSKKTRENDVEAKGTDPRPGDPAFADFLNKKMQDFYGKRGQAIKAWARNKGLSAEMFDKMNFEADSEKYTPDQMQHARDQQQLYLILFMEFLLYSVGIAVLNLVAFADRKNGDGTMKRNRLILPGQRRLKKWILNIGREDTSIDQESPDSIGDGARNVYMGPGFDPKKDPEHLPPQTAWQRFGTGLRTIPHFLGSTESAFGFRVACATLTVGIVAFLKDTQIFFIEQRLVWAMIIIAIGMTMTSGQSMFGFFGRVAGTLVAMISSIVIWYIVDQKTPGVIVFLWFFIFLAMYFFLKFPRFIGVWLISIVTTVLIVGYELQVRKVGLKLATSSGQPYYPIYELAPYRLACVAGGSFVAFLWTILPYPISDRSWLRKDLGKTLFLLANFYAAVHSTIRARMHDTEGDMELKSSPGRKLEKVRHKIFEKLLLLLPSLQQHADWQKWEITVGGKFPRETYENIALRATNIMGYLSLVSYATQSFSSDDRASYKTFPTTRTAWLNDLTKLIDTVSPTSDSITSTLSLLSASVIQGSALPPYLVLPASYDLSKRLKALDSGILDARHVEEPGYSAYAVMQVASSLVTDDLKRLVSDVRDLVGTTDFSFTVDFSESSLDSTRKGKRE